MNTILPIIVLFLAAGQLSAQDQAQLMGKSMPELRRLVYPVVEQNHTPTLSTSSLFWRKPLTTTNAPDLRQALLRPPTTPRVYSYQDLAFFCRLEVQLEKSVGMPVKFRLGDVQMVEQMERQRASFQEQAATIPRNFPE